MKHLSIISSRMTRPVCNSVVTVQSVIPAKAGIQLSNLDPRLRGDDNRGAKRLHSVLGLFLAAGFFVFPCMAHASWEKSVQPPSAETPVDLAPCPGKEDCFYAATTHQVFRYQNNNWEPVFNLNASGDAIVRIRAFSIAPFLWIQTQSRIFNLHLNSGASQKIYETKDTEKFPLSFSSNSESLWLGTSSGLWVSKNSGKNWQKRSDLADHRRVDLVTETQTGLFFSSDSAWHLQDENGIQAVLKIFNSSNKDIESETLLDSENTTLKETAFFDFLETEEAFYLATVKGVFQSKNGFDWQALSNSGLRNTSVQRIFWNRKEKELSGLTRDGFFRFDQKTERWRSQNEGLAKLDLRVAIVAATGLILANSEGLWHWNEKASGSNFDLTKNILFQKLIRLEPSAREIHAKVIRYSDTSNAKIKRWHAQSRLASLMPSLSLGKDWGVSNNVDLDRASTSDPDRFIDGPWNKDRGADLDLSWDLGDFIFSSNQTSIDSRAKLMVDQRNDLLSEVTRIYFERRRLQREIIAIPAADENEHTEKIMRLDELTALIDAQTHGYFSEKLEMIYKQNQELEEIWKFKELKV